MIRAICIHIFCYAEFCLAVDTSSSLYGDFHWPKTHTGYRVYVQCPYVNSTQIPVYGARVCTSNDTHSNWLPEVIDTCPERPLTEAMRSARSILYPQKSVGKYELNLLKFSFIIRILSRMEQLWSSHGACWTQIGNMLDLRVLGPVSI